MTQIDEIEEVLALNGVSVGDPAGRRMLASRVFNQGGHPEDIEALASHLATQNRKKGKDQDISGLLYWMLSKPDWRDRLADIRRNAERAQQKAHNASYPGAGQWKQPDLAADRTRLQRQAKALYDSDRKSPQEIAALLSVPVDEVLGLVVAGREIMEVAGARNRCHDHRGALRAFLASMGRKLQEDVLQEEHGSNFTDHGAPVGAGEGTLRERLDHGGDRCEAEDQSERSLESGLHPRTMADAAAWSSGEVRPGEDEEPPF